MDLESLLRGEQRRKPVAVAAVSNRRNQNDHDHEEQDNANVNDDDELPQIPQPDNANNYDDDDEEEESLSHTNNAPTNHSQTQTRKDLDATQRPNKMLSLQERCRLFIVAHLDQYVPESFGCLPEEDWESIVELRHSKTQPQSSSSSSKKKSAGIDGKGRLTSAIRADIMSKIETCNPHLAESNKTDVLIWKDCVNQKFKPGSFTRPTALNYPWPILLTKIQKTGQHLLDYLVVQQPSTTKEQQQQLGEEKEESSVKTKKKSTRSRNSSIHFEQHIEFLSTVPMNVSLLQATSIGKTLRQFLKQCKKLSNDHPAYNMIHTIPNDESRPSVSNSIMANREHKQQSPIVQLEELLQSWKNLAKASGVQLVTTPLSSSTTKDDHHDQQQQIEKDLKLCESCKSWRDLYQILTTREVTVRANQGARMREMRQNLNKGRPKIVKVRPASQKHTRILEKHHKIQQQAKSSSGWGGSTPMTPGAKKMNQLRKETASLSALRHNTKVNLAAAASSSHKRPAFDTRTTTTTVGGGGSGFGAAVQFASGPKQLRTSSAKRQKVMKVMTIQGNRQMKLPAHKTAPRNALLASRQKPSPSSTSSNNRSGSNSRSYNNNTKQQHQQQQYRRR